MTRVYNLQLRVLVSSHQKGFCAQALEIEGSVTAPTRQAAISGFVAGVQGMLYNGTPIFRACSEDLQGRWERCQTDSTRPGLEYGYIVRISATYPDEKTATS